MWVAEPMVVIHCGKRWPPDSSVASLLSWSNVNVGSYLRQVQSTPNILRAFGKRIAVISNDLLNLGLTD